jgi:hypothetical protein
MFLKMDVIKINVLVVEFLELNIFTLSCQMYAETLNN